LHTAVIYCLKNIGVTETSKEKRKRSKWESVRDTGKQDTGLHKLPQSKRNTREKGKAAWGMSWGVTNTHADQEKTLVITKKV